MWGGLQLLPGIGHQPPLIQLSSPAATLIERPKMARLKTNESTACKVVIFLTAVLPVATSAVCAATAMVKE